jgi:signal transduction histidine kinase/FixJ family two-component response regulator
VRKDGTIRWVDVHVRRFPDAAGETPKSFASISDVTERKEAELALKEADRRKDEFLATLAHELRNPLAPLRSGIEILKRRHDDPNTAAKVHAMMERQVNHMVHLIDDLLDVSRITRGQLQLQKGPVDVADVVSEAIEACQGAIDGAGHTLSVSIEGAPLTVDGDSTRLMQVVENLLSNAAKYTEPPGEIRVRACRRGDRVVVSVKDTGIGIPPDKAQFVFDLFAQVHGTRGSGKERGLGIGLHLIKRLVQMHGGTIELHSAGMGAGTEFIVQLPLASQAAPAAVPGLRTSADESPLSILVVDDNRDAAESLTMMLQLLGHEVRTAFGGAEALDVIAAVSPDVLLLDIGMPDIDGHEVARRIRSGSLSPQPVIVAVSGWGQAADRAKSAAAGFHHHLVKPVDLDDLQQLLATLSRPERAASASSSMHAPTDRDDVIAASRH